jgi:hypothetical protein
LTVRELLDQLDLNGESQEEVYLIRTGFSDLHKTSAFIRVDGKLVLLGLEP